MKFKKLLTILAICSLLFVFTACDDKKEPETSEQVQETVQELENEVAEEINEIKEDENEIISGMPNPVVQYDTVEDAVAHVGHLCSIPTIYARYNQEASVISDTLIQIQFSDDQGPIVLLREERRPSGDISGNYNEFEYESTFESNGNTVTVKGDSEDEIILAIWNDGAYSHSLNYETGHSLEEVKDAVDQIQ